MTSGQPAQARMWSPSTAATSGAESTGGETEAFALSSQQRFLQMVDNGSVAGPFGPRYTIVGGWRVSGPLDVGALRQAVDAVVARHEALRTQVVRVNNRVVQRVWPASVVPLEIYELGAVPLADRERRAEQFVIEIEDAPLSIDRVPTLRAVLGRFDDDDAILVLGAHHSAVDGWSIQVVVHDIASYYAAARHGSAANLPATRQYQDYVRWQRSNSVTGSFADSLAYWRQRLAGARTVPMRMDWPRSAQRPDVTSWYRFQVEDDIRAAVQAVATEQRASPFMVMMAAYMMFLRDRTGETDLVVPTFTPGRRPAWTQQMVGTFFNLMPLRVNLSGVRTFRDLVSQVRVECLASYSHEIPFVDILSVAPDLMSAAADDQHASCVFQVVQSPFMMRGGRAADVRLTAMRRRLLYQEAGSQIPDGALWAMEIDPAGGIVGSVGYGRGQFARSSIAHLTRDYCDLLRKLVLDGSAGSSARGAGN